MAAILPNPFALNYSGDKCYLTGGAGGIFKFTGQDPTPLFTTENGQIPGHVHIKYSVNGKYLVKKPGQTQIVATADKRNEDKTDENCTLFGTELIQSNDTKRVLFRLRHVQNNLYVRVVDRVPYASTNNAQQAADFTAVGSD